MWYYRAEDEEGNFLAESHSELELISAVWERFGMINFRIIRRWRER